MITIRGIGAHAPTEEKNEQTKYIFYERSEETCDRCPSHDLKFVLGDFYAKIGKENIFGPTLRKVNLHSEAPNQSDDADKDFAAAKKRCI